MARPIKNNADYFPHDADMRNDPRVKALRRKFGIKGYGIYCMAVEYLTDAEHFTAPVDNLGLELMAGDFDIETDDLQTVLNYCTQIDLFQLENDFLRCNSLEKRLNPLLSKRESDRDRVSASNRSENRHSKVKESKVYETKVNESITPPRNFEWFKSQIDSIWSDQLPTEKKQNLGRALEESWLHLSANKFELVTIDGAGCKRLVNSWLSKMKPENGKHIQSNRLDLSKI